MPTLVVLESVRPYSAHAVRILRPSRTGFSRDARVVAALENLASAPVSHATKSVMGSVRAGAATTLTVTSLTVKQGKSQLLQSFGQIQVDQVRKMPGIVYN